MSEAEVSPPNAIIFICDEHNPNLAIPNSANDILVASNDTCVSVGTQHPVDGSTRIQLLNRAPSLELYLVFSGKIDAPTKHLSVVTSQAVRILSIGVTCRRPELRVWVDDLRSPSELVAEVRCP